MKFSLVLATINRSDEIKGFLQSLKKQTYRNFELIVVDQNLDKRLIPILKRFEEEFKIKHLCSEKGLSKARNIGLKHIDGDVIAFPDDDCQYPPDLLENVNGLLQEHSDWDGVTGKCLNFQGNQSVGKFDITEGKLNKFNCWKRATSITIFLREEVIRKVGDFDETLGAGADTQWGSGEEIDYILRALKKRFNIMYVPDQVIALHPSIKEEYNDKMIKRHSSYSKGMGRVISKHNYPIWFISWYLIRAFGGVIINLLLLNFKKAHQYLVILIGRFVGWNSI